MSKPLLKHRIFVWVVRAIRAVVVIIPYEISFKFVGLLLRIVMPRRPRYWEVATRNVRLAFPDLSEPEVQRFAHRNCYALARLMVDAARIGALSSDWVQEHVEWERYEEYLELRASLGNKGLLIATGHLGSFELVAHAVTSYGHPLHYVARDLKPAFFNEWWCAEREKLGNTVVPREGAYKKILKAVGEGHDLALMIDQNLTRNHAAFVDWFGRPAATTKTLGIVALRHRSTVIVASMAYLGEERYRIQWEHQDFTELYDDPSLSTDEKIFQIIQQCSDVFQDMIRRRPEEWFWFHRRWKTTPEGIPEDFYTSSNPTPLTLESIR